MVNNVTLMGRLTARPELKTTQSGATVTGFCIAVDRRYKTKDGDKQTDFINCVAWRNTAEFITRYFDKGDLIAVTGEIQTRQYTDNNGNKRTAFEILIDQASFCGGKNTGNSDNSGNNTDSNSTPPTMPQMPPPNWETLSDDEELPF